MTASDSVSVDSARRSDVERVVNVRLSTEHGDFLAVGYLDHNRGTNKWRWYTATSRARTH